MVLAMQALSILQRYEIDLSSGFDQKLKCQYQTIRSANVLVMTSMN